MSPHDVIEVPWQPGAYARRVLVEKLERAGRPPINSAGRLKDEQQEAWDAFQDGTGSPADDPNRPNLFPLAHVRFVAADITPTAERVRRLSAEGLVRPYKKEPWHWQLPNVYDYPLVQSLPTPASTDATPTQEEDDMFGEKDREKAAETHQALYNDTRRGAGWPGVLERLEKVEAYQKALEYTLDGKPVPADLAAAMGGRRESYWRALGRYLAGLIK